MAELESSHFYLSTTMATTNTNNMGGYLVFNNFNMREILGDLYDKYDKFKLVLNAVSNSNTNTTMNYERHIAIQMSGLSWVNCLDYSSNDSTTATLGILSIGVNSLSNNQMSSNWGCVFNKPSNNNVSLTISLYGMFYNEVRLNNDYGNTTFYFNIYGVK